MPSQPAPIDRNFARSLRGLLDLADMATAARYSVVLVPDDGEPAHHEFDDAHDVAAFLRTARGSAYVTLGVVCRFLDGPLRLSTPDGEFLMTDHVDPPEPAAFARLGGAKPPTPELADATEDEDDPDAEDDPEDDLDAEEG